MNQQTTTIFNYPNLTSLDLEKGRVYEIERDLFFPSITTVLGATVSEDKKQSLKSWQDYVKKMKQIEF